MAQKTSVQLIDDLDGSEAASTVGFAWAGKGYELDLSAENQARLEEALAPFIDKARRTNRPAGFGGELRRGRGLPRSSNRSGGDAAIRAWGLANNYAVSDRGRVSALLRKAYSDAKQRGEITDQPATAE
jgi:hypothetical protein